MNEGYHGITGYAFGMRIMNEKEFLHWLDGTSSRYHMNAYRFTLEALKYTQFYFKKTRHVTGQELLVGIARLARDKFGDLAWTVFQEWGVHTSRDFGNIVFSLVEVGEIKKTDEDHIEDFDSGFDLQKELQQIEIEGNSPSLPH